MALGLIRPDIRALFRFGPERRVNAAQALTKPSIKETIMADDDLRAKCARDNVVTMVPRARLRSDVPPFDPTNPAHLRAWESVWDFAQAELARAERDAPAQPR